MNAMFYVVYNTLISYLFSLEKILSSEYFYIKILTKLLFFLFDYQCFSCKKMD